MRQVENEMNNAIRNARSFQSANTSVRMIDDVNAAVFLHGNEIATVNTRTGLVMVNEYTLRNWPTNTTMSRLRALGVDVCRKGGVAYLNGERV